MGGQPAPVLILDSLDSTNAEARRRAEAGETGPLWIVARRQTAGRGRRGRAWSSDAGDLAATLLTTVRRPPAEAAQLTFAAALAVADLAEAYVPASLVRIKWPNDVMVDGRKVSGVLLESAPRPDGGLWLAVGIGVNLARAPSDTERPATALADHLRADVPAPPTVEAAADRLASAFAAWMERWAEQGAEGLIPAWTERAAGLDGPCVARLGAQTLSGRAEGVEADGALRLRLPSGELRRISAGDVFFGESA